MALSEEAKKRLADVVALQPTKNGELQERWDMESGSEVHGFLESELKQYYYRDDNSLIRATDEAAELVDVEPGGEGDDDDTGPRVVQVTPVQRAVLSVVAGPHDDPESVVSVFHAVEDAGGSFDVEDVRAALKSLAGKGVLTTVRKTVPTYKLTTARENLEIRPLDADPDATNTDTAKDEVLADIEAEFGSS